MDHKMYFKRKAICGENRNRLYLCIKRHSFHRRRKMGRMIRLRWNTDQKKEHGLFVVYGRARGREEDKRTEHPGW